MWLTTEHMELPLTITLWCLPTTILVMCVCAITHIQMLKMLCNMQYHSYIEDEIVLLCCVVFIAVW